jgi:thioredoxin-dependent peroxiredoxin
MTATVCSFSVGQVVPDFTAPTTEGEFSLRQHKKPLVLYFYPKDNTPGCTDESMQFAAAHAQFAQLGVTVLGCSRDSLKSHSNFRSKLSLPFDLISDSDERLCTLFCVIKDKMMYGKKVRGIERSSFIIGADGVLQKEWRGLKVAGHVDAVLAFLNS